MQPARLVLAEQHTYLRLGGHVGARGQLAHATAWRARFEGERQRAQRLGKAHTRERLAVPGMDEHRARRHEASVIAARAESK